MSAVTEGKWQQREEAWAEDGREVEVVSWGMLEAEHMRRLRCARDDYEDAYWYLNHGCYTTAKLCVESGRMHKRAAMAYHRLLVERARARRGNKKRSSGYGRERLRPYGTKALTERARM